MAKTYIITDTHFNGKVWGDPSYTDKIFENWEKTVKPQDTIIHGGDIASGKFNKIADRIKSMPGYKILIRGNHDCSKNEKYLEVFDEVHYQMIRENIVYSHYPVDARIYNCSYNIFGHFHRYPKNMRDSLVVRYKDFFEFERNFTYVMTDWDFTPIEISTFVKKCSEHAKLCFQL